MIQNVFVCVMRLFYFDTGEFGMSHISTPILEFHYQETLTFNVYVHVREFCYEADMIFVIHS